MLWSLIDLRRFFSFSSETSHYWLFICDTYILCLKYTDSLTQRTIAQETSLQAVEIALSKANFHSCLAHSSPNYILLTKINQVYLFLPQDSIASPLISVFRRWESQNKFMGQLCILKPYTSS